MSGAESVRPPFRRKKEDQMAEPVIAARQPVAVKLEAGKHDGAPGNGGTPPAPSAR